MYTSNVRLSHFQGTYENPEDIASLVISIDEVRKRTPTIVCCLVAIFVVMAALSLTFLPAYSSSQ